ncbi:unnamed protein product [Rotaria socialis]|uniref:long-chain-fatty-acid--CoA ligase n=1 Tax=Rotaria socialis TaxID=392032 RepID=A0A821P479_9BILA|nr:unnamed protein product [Rotaria socialis]CAF4799987.1 unnamed protein product [Rotaria socialis]
MESNIFVHPSYWECDDCKRILKHGEFRFNCVVCPDYDQCETCTATVQPPHPHRLVREIAYGYVEETEHSRVDLAARIQAAITTYQVRYCMGVRDVDPHNPQIYTDSYSWQTFKTIGERLTNFSHGLRRFIKPRTYVGICAANRPEWLMTDFACILQSFITVPIYCLFTDRDIAFILQNTSLSIVVCDKEMLPKFIRLHSECPLLQHIVCMDPIPETISKVNGLSIHYMGTLERYGSLKRYEYTITEPDDCITVIYTSGSSGFPKGAIISESSLRNNFSSVNSAYRSERIRLCYRPFSWATDRLSSIGLFLQGGRTGFSTGDVSRLMEELTLVRPTTFSAPPTIWNKIYAEYKANLALMTTDQSITDITLTEEVLLEKFSKLIPLRCHLLSIGGAMVNSAVLDFMKRCFKRCEIVESYGTTECGGIAYDELLDTGINYSLESVPEMGYTLADKPFPRGELLVKTGTMFSGYINNPEETKMAITDSGFFRTGDIVELRPEKDGKPRIHIIDRKKSFFKLSQGQFISPESLQEIYMQSPFVEQIYIHGNPLEDSVSAVIVPNKDYARAFATKHNLLDLDNDHPNTLFYDAIMQDLYLLAKKESLRKHEIPSKLIIEFEPFTSENGLLTSSMKLCRYRLATHYGDRLKTIESIEVRLKSMIERAIERSLTIDETSNFMSIGGDSLAAIRLSRMIQEDLGVPIPIDILFDSNMNLESLVKTIKNPSRILSFPNSIISQLLNDSIQELNITIKEKKNESVSPSTIFITGTTGFVGAFLLAELLKVYPSDCKFICLVRCQITANPLKRIKENMAFLQLWNDKYQDRIIALRGDLSEEHFGLDIQTYSALATCIDVIFHCGAIVNFVLPYNALYRSNVLGTLEVIRLATYSDACIPVQYISTISVLPSEITQEVHIDEISPNHLRSGYAQSKWVAEKLIAKANRSGLPVNIYRLGSIWGHTETGACNQNDINTLLLAAIMKTECYPTISPHMKLNGLPANLAARSIVSLSHAELHVYGRTYHVVPSNEGISFENIIEGIQNCGIALIDLPYNDWKVKLTLQSSKKRSFESVAEFFANNPFERMPSAKSSSNTIYDLTFPSIDKVYIRKWLTFILNNIVN